MVAKIKTAQQKQNIIIFKKIEHGQSYCLVIISPRAIGNQLSHLVLSSLGNVERWSISLEILQSTIAATVAIELGSQGGCEQLLV